MLSGSLASATLLGMPWSRLVLETFFGAMMRLGMAELMSERGELVLGIRGNRVSRGNLGKG